MISEQNTNEDNHRAQRKDMRKTTHNTNKNNYVELLKKLGPEKFSQEIKNKDYTLITDTTMRDAHQSLLATRMRTEPPAGTPVQVCVSDRESAVGRVLRPCAAIQRTSTTRMTSVTSSSTRATTVPFHC